MTQHTESVCAKLLLEEKNFLFVKQKTQHFSTKRKKKHIRRIQKRGVDSCFDDNRKCGTVSCFEREREIGQNCGKFSFGLFWDMRWKGKNESDVCESHRDLRLGCRKLRHGLRDSSVCKSLTKHKEVNRIKVLVVKRRQNLLNLTLPTHKLWPGCGR